MQYFHCLLKYQDSTSTHPQSKLLCQRKLNSFDMSSSCHFYFGLFLFWGLVGELLSLDYPLGPYCWIIYSWINWINYCWIGCWIIYSWIFLVIWVRLIGLEFSSSFSSWYKIGLMFATCQSSGTVLVCP